MLVPEPRPLVDLHRHLEGSLRPSTVLELARENGHPLGRARTPRALLVVPGPVGGLLPYLRRVDAGAGVLRTEDDWRRAAREAVADAYDDGLDRLELRFSPWFVGTETGLAPEAVIDAVADGVRTASATTGLPVGLIGIILRDLGPERGLDQVATILSRRETFVGIDLAGDEAGVPAADFAPAYRRARDAGLHATAHAGEAAGPASVWAVIEELGAERVGHGVRSAEDPRLLERLADAGITLEVALTSNVHTGAASGFREHPIHALLAAGVPVALCTDDPTASNTRLSHEFQVARTDAGLRETQLDLIAERSALAAFGSP